MLVEFNTGKFYLGYPIVVLGYKDDDYGYNITTNSSTYSLRNNIVRGVSSDSRAAQQIEKYGEFTVNVAAEPVMTSVESAGWWHEEDKLSRLDLNTQTASTINAPLLTDFPIIFECTVKKIEKWITCIISSPLLSRDGLTIACSRMMARYRLMIMLPCFCR